MSNDTAGTEDRAEQHDDRAFRVNEVEVRNSGRLTIPARFRNRHEVEEGDVIDLRVRAEDVTFFCLDLIVGSKGRVRIPSRKRDLYGIEDGDMVDFDVMPTGMVADPD